MVQELATRAEDANDDDNRRALLQGLQFFAGSAVAMGGPIDPKSVSVYETALTHLLQAMYMLCKHRGAFAGGTRLRQQVCVGSPSGPVLSANSMVHA